MEINLCVTPQELFKQVNDFAESNQLVFFMPKTKELKQSISESDFKDSNHKTLFIDFWIVEPDFKIPDDLFFIHKTDQYGVGVRLLMNKKGIPATVFDWHPTRSPMGKRIGTLLKKYVAKHNYQGMLTDDPVWDGSTIHKSLKKYYWHQSVLECGQPLLDWASAYTEIKPDLSKLKAN